MSEEKVKYFIVAEVTDKYNLCFKKVNCIVESSSDPKELIEEASRKILEDYKPEAENAFISTFNRI